MSRGLRNCNPGNIRRSIARYRGEVQPSQDPAFKQFESLEWGYRAIFVTLDTYQRKHGLRTIAEMIGRWAPPTENHTRAYVQAVARQAGIAPCREINTRDRATMIPMVAAMSRIENGEPANRKALERGWELFMDSHGTKQKA
ncbi:MAG: structural protein P5 [Alistipes sp.]|nr:structural protein P5 [Alistipes sp.]